MNTPEVRLRPLRVYMFTTCALPVLLFVCSVLLCGVELGLLSGVEVTVASCDLCANSTYRTLVNASSENSSSPLTSSLDAAILLELRSLDSDRRVAYRYTSITALTGLSVAVLMLSVVCYSSLVFSSEFTRGRVTSITRQVAASWTLSAHKFKLLNERKHKSEELLSQVFPLLRHSILRHSIII